MKSNRDLILEAISYYHQQYDGEGVSTLYLSSKLGIKRPNVSALLSKLVEEGEIKKHSGRPVLYSLVSIKEKDSSCFKQMIGYDSSLKNAIQLAKAAILYPKQCLNVLITGPSGSGKSLFSKTMYDYAKQRNVLSETAPFIKVNCKHYIDHDEEFIQDLFSETGYFIKANQGILFIDNIEYLPTSIKNKLIDYLDTGTLTYEGRILTTRFLLICACHHKANPVIIDTFSRKIPIHIELPSLEQRSLEERFSLIQLFFTKEAREIKKDLVINSELLRCLLLYDCEGNINQLRKDIKIGCANAYVREFNQIHATLEVFISDMEHYVRKGFLKYKRSRHLIEAMIPTSYHYTFSSEGFDKQASQLDTYKTKNIYDMIEEKVETLNQRGIPQKDIGLLLSIEVDNAFRMYRHTLSEQVVNSAQLSKIVSEDILELVEVFLKEASIKFDVDYPVSVFYGLSLHLHAMIERMKQREPLSTKQISDIVENYKDEYAFSLQFAKKLEKHLTIQLPIDEVVLITMFICHYDTSNSLKQGVVVLVAMHGDLVATSISKVIQSLLKSSYIHGFDVSLDKPFEHIYNALKEKIISIHQGVGIVLIYDMGSIETMSDMIQEETNIKMRYIKMPLTLIGLECARKAGMGENIDNIVDNALSSLQQMYQHVPIVKQTLPQCIVTVCYTGVGGALQIKQYLERYLDSSISVHAYSMADLTKLEKQMDMLKEAYDVVAVVGTVNPNILNVPYISIAAIFEQPIETIDQLLGLKGRVIMPIDYASIYDYLDSQLEGVEIKKLKKVLPQVIENINLLVDNTLSIDQTIGLFIHIASSINRLVLKGKIPRHLQKETVLSKHEDLFKHLLTTMKPIEKMFHIVFSDDEFAHIITIIKKL